ncbi:MAG: hypothetical protein PHQ00_01330, partial [Phycisphaerae bacterium]|nr:hypothetical protein [Phycisphaerae bacterium]
VTVKNPDGEPIFSEIDDVNNLEKVDIRLPADGNYTISLSNNTSKSGNYGLAFELLAPLTGDFNIDYIVDGYDLSRIAEEWLTAGFKADIVSDNIVNNLDFAEFADNWLKTDKRYFCP